MPKPRVEHVRDLHDHIDKTWLQGEQGKQDAFFKSLYFQDFSILLPDTKDERRTRQFDMERIKLAEGTRIVDLLQSRYITPPYVGVRPASAGPSAPAREDDLEWGMNESVDQLNPGIQGQGPYHIGRFQQILFGRLAELILPGHEYYWDFPWRREGETEDEWWERYELWQQGGPLPVSWQPLPAESTFPPDLASIEEEALSLGVMSWAEMQRVFSKGELSSIRGADEIKPYDQMTVATYSDREHIGWYALKGGEQRKWGPVPLGHTRIEDAALRVIPHNMGRCAIRILPGMTTGRKEPGKYWKSALYAVADMIMQAEALASLVLTGERRRVLPATKAYLRGVNTDEAGALARIKFFQESDIWPLDLGDRENPPENLEPFFEPSGSADAMNFLAVVLGKVARVSHTPAVLEGEVGPSGTPAWSVNFAAETAKGGTADLTRSVGAAHIDSMEGVMRAVSAFGEPVRLTRFTDDRMKQVTLHPDIVKQYRPLIKTDFQPKITINKRADYALYGQLAPVAQQFGVPSITWLAKELLGVERPWEMFKEQITWQWATSEPIRNALAKDALDEAMADVQGDEEMPEQQALELVMQLPEPLRSALMKQMQLGGQNGQGLGATARTGMPRPGGGVPGLGRSPDLQGSLQAATTRQPGGPKPQEELA